jgi:hypothetical protein
MVSPKSPEIPKSKSSQDPVIIRGMAQDARSCRRLARTGPQRPAQVRRGVALRKAAQDNPAMMTITMKRLTAISLLVLGLLGCESPEKLKPTSSEREADARAVFQRFQTSLKDKNADEKVACLTSGAVNGFYLFWRGLVEAEGLSFDMNEGFYDLTKDSAVEAGVVDADTVQLVVPVKLKHSSKIVITLVGSGKGCRIDKFEAVK